MEVTNSNMFEAIDGVAADHRSTVEVTADFASQIFFSVYFVTSVFLPVVDTSLTPCIIFWHACNKKF
jgi:hypothetical protein